MPEVQVETPVAAVAASLELRLRNERMGENYSSESFRFGARFAARENALAEYHTGGNSDNNKV
jgi:hypothetical protein